MFASEASWQFVGGCFADNEHALYKSAQPGEVYDFENVQIEVRQANDGSIFGSAESVDTESESSGNISWLFYTLCFLFLFAALVAGGMLAFQMLKK